MKHKTLKAIVITSLFIMTSQAQAGLWDDTKETAANAWEKTKETSVDIKDGAKETATNAWERTKETSAKIKEGAVEKWNQVTTDKSDKSDKADVTSKDSGALSEIKKLGDKETYVKAWEGIKESAKNPSKPNVDENGIPKNN